MFQDRKEAGKQLAQWFELYRGKNALVLALPRGGVVTGYEVARALKFSLDIATVRKIGHPTSPEYAIGAVDESGAVMLNDAEAAAINKSWLKKEIAKQRKEAQRQNALYREGRKTASLAGRILILVDDGIATGLTIRLAVCSLKAQRPEKIIVAVPVAPPEALPALKKEGAHEVIVLDPPEEFTGSVGAHYVRFEQVEDAEVIQLLRQTQGSGSKSFN